MEINVKKFFSHTRWRNELKRPSREISRKVLDTWYHFQGKKEIGVEGLGRNSPVVVWDWNSNAITYDFLWALFQVWVELTSCGHDKFDLVILASEPLESFGLYADSVTLHQQNTRIDELIIPIATHFSAVTSVRRVESFDELVDYLENKKAFIKPRYFSKNYRPSIVNYKKIFKYLLSASATKSKIHPLLSLKSENPKFEIPNSSSRKIVDAEKSSNKRKSSFLTLTLRDYGWNPERNTSQWDIDQAYLFAKQLQLDLVLVPDSLDNIHSYFIPDDVVLASDARIDFSVRLDLYSKSEVNLFTVCGPLVSSLLAPNSRSICFNYGACGPDADETYNKKNYDIRRGQQPFLALNGYVLWTVYKGNYTFRDLYQAYKTILDNL